MAVRTRSARPSAARPPSAERPSPAARTARAARTQRVMFLVAERSLLIALVLIVLMPFVLILLTSLMTNEQTLSPSLWPQPFQWHNFAEIFTQVPLLRYGWNTLVYAGLATLGTLVSSVPAAYALAKMRWRGRNLWFLLTVAVMMLPAQVTLVPLYSLWARLDLVGTLAPLIVPMWFGHAFSIFLLRQFFLTIPQEYLEAAKVDGSSELRTLVQVVLPLARPAIAAVAVFQFTFCWNDFMGPLLYVGNDDLNWTLSVGLAQFRSTYQVEWNLTMAAALAATLPVVVLFFFAQRAFVHGVTLTGVKG